MLQLDLRRHWGRNALGVALLAVLSVFLLWPIALTVWGGFGPWSGDTFAQKLASLFQYFTGDTGVLFHPLYREGLINSLLIATFTTLLSLLIALPLAILAARFEFRGKAIVTSLVMAPLILAPFVGAIGLRALLGRAGSLNAMLRWSGLLGEGDPGIDFLGGGVGGRFWGVVLMEALHLYPIFYLNLTAALANVDPTLEEAAQSVGAGPWRRFTRVTLPLIAPGLFAGGTIVFIWSFTELGTPLMFDYYTVTPVQIFWGIYEMQSNPQPYALVVVMLTVAVGLYVLSRAMLGQRGSAMLTKASIAGGLRRLTGWRGTAAALAFAVLISAALLPHIGVVLSAFTVNGSWYESVLPESVTLDHFRQALGHPLATGSIRNSLFYASVATIAALFIGLAIAVLNVRHRRNVWGAGVLDSLAMLPLAVPGLVLAFGYVAMTLYWPFNMDNAAGRTLAGWFSVFGVAPNPIPLLIIAYAIRRLPYVVRSASAGLEQTAVELEEAAQNLGATGLTTLRRVTLPLITANLIAGGILAFSFAMLEVSDSLILAQKEQHYPITKAIFELFNRLGDGPYIASAMGVWAMALLTVTLIGAGQFMGKRLGAIFRV